MTEPRPLLLGMGWDRPGGLNRYVVDLWSALDRAGAGPGAVVLGPATDVPASVVVAGDESAPMVTRLRRYAGAARRVVGAYDVVDAHFALYAWWPVVVGGARGRPLVVHFHGPWADESVAGGERPGAKVRAKRRLEASVYRRAARLIVLSDAFADLLVEQYGVERSRVRVVQPGVDLERFTPGPERERRIGGDGATVFTARRLVSRMGLDVLLDAWSRMAAGGHQLLIAGEGPARPDLEARIAALGLDASVRLLGRISEDELLERYRAADVCVMPSLALEGFGLTAVESMAAGTPVVVTDVGGLPSAVRGLDPGLVVPPGDAGALADRLEAALDGDLPSRAACRAHAETFSWERAAELHLEVYREAVRGPGAVEGANGPRLRVVYLDHCARLSGAEIALVRLLDALGDVDAHVILGEDGPIRAQLEGAGAVVEVLPLAASARDLGRGRVRPSRLPVASAWHTGVHVLRLARRLRQLRPDVVHTNSLKSALYGSVAGRLAGVPVVWHARDRVAADYLPGPAVRAVRLAARWLPDAVVANSAATLTTLELPAVGRHPAVVVADPFRLAVPTPATSAPDGAGLRVGMVGRLSPWKGQHVFLEAFAKARPGGPDTAVIIGSAMFGEEAYEAELRLLIDRLGLAHRVQLAGFRADVERELARLDVLVHASVVPEPFGQVVVEGMAAGLPVIASGAGGPAEIITDGVDGLLHAPGDVDDLAAVLDRLLGDEALRSRLAQAGRVRAADFSPDVVGPEVMAVYRRVAGKGRRRHRPAGQPLTSMAGAPRQRPDIHIVGAVLPGHCGVRDHGVLVADQLRRRGFAVRESWFVDDGLRIGHTLATAVRLARVALGCRRGDRVLWQYASYSYAFRGLSFPGVAFGLLCKARGARVVSFLHEPTATWEPQTLRRAIHAVTQRLALRVVLAGTTTPVVNTDRRAGDLVRLGRRDVRVVPVHSNIPVVGAEPTGLGDRFTIGVLSFGAGEVRPDLLFAALVELRWHDVRVLLIGGPGAASESADRWRQEAGSAGLSDVLEFTDVLPADELSRRISSVDVFAQVDQLGASSRRGTVAAMLAHGRPVVSLDGPDRWERLVEENVIVTVPATVQALADGLAELRRSPSRRSELGARGVDFYERNMRVELAADALAGMLTAVPERGDPGARRPPRS